MLIADVHWQMGAQEMGNTAMRHLSFEQASSNLRAGKVIKQRLNNRIEAGTNVLRWVRVRRREISSWSRSCRARRARTATTWAS